MGAQIRHWRDKRGWSAQVLADQVTAAGHPLTRSNLANLENGRRPDVSLSELLAIAGALGVPPLLLLAPTDGAATVEPAPGRMTEPSRMLDWLRGDNVWQRLDRPESIEYDVEAWHAFQMLHWLGGVERQLEEEWLAAVPRHLLDKKADDAVEALAATIRETRAWLTEHGVMPPPIPPGLADVLAEPLAVSVAREIFPPAVSP